MKILPYFEHFEFITQFSSIVGILCVIFIVKRRSGYFGLQKIALAILLIVLYPLVVAFNPGVIISPFRLLPFGVLIQGTLGFSPPTRLSERLTGPAFSKIKVGMASYEVESLTGFPFAEREFYDEGKVAFFSNSPTGSSYWMVTVTYDVSDSVKKAALKYYID